MKRRRGYGEGSVFQRADGRWCGVVSLGYGGDGKRRRKVVYGDTKTGVQQELRKLQTSADAGTLGDAGRLTVGEWMTRWLENAVRPRVRANTYQRYEILVRLNIIALLGGVPLAKLRAPHVEGFYAAMERRGDSADARKRTGTVLTNALRHAVRLKLIPFNPASDVVKAKPENREMLFLNEGQVRQFLGAAQGNRLYALFALAVGSGMRQGELFALKWADIDLDAGTVSVQRSVAEVKGEFVVKEPKSRSGRRTITLPPFAVDALRQHRAAMLAEGNIAAPVFCTGNGNYISKSNMIRKAFKPVLKRAGLPDIRFHDLRHTHASLLLSQGQSIKAVSHRLGHSKADVTLRVYAHVMPADDKKLAEGLNRLFG